MIKSKTPRYQVAATCTFDFSDDEEGDGYVGHWVDFEAKTFEPFAKAPEFSYKIELVEWVAGPLFERNDIRFDEHEKTGLQEGWTLNFYNTADESVNVIDVTVMPTIDGHEVFQRKMTLTYDLRTKPVRAYLLLTEDFDLESGAGKNKRVSVSAQAGTCAVAED